ncbi:outer membrane beta-barrel protein [Deminuibacter soli]|nr:outer membrane beta-barrel protein [Deminuibacter soli]
MYPGDQLWRNIHEQLHERGRWPALTFISIIIIALLVVSTLLLKPADKLLNNTRYRMATPEVQLALATPAPNSVEPLEESIATEIITRRTIDDARQRIHEQNAPAADIAVAASVTAAAIAPAPPPVAAQLQLPAEATAQALVDTFNFSRADTLPASGIAFNAAYRFDTLTYNNKFNFSANAATHNPNDELLKNLGFTKQTTAITLKPRISRFDIEAYITPSASYRRLLNDKGNADLQRFLPTPLSGNTSVDVNKVVRHKPAIGMEVGVLLGYRLNRQLTLKGGLQYNQRQYDIEAYTQHSNDQPLPGSSSGPGPQPAPTYDNSTTVNTLSILKNRYRELSLPIGIDWKASATKPFTWGVTALAAPTYMFNKDPFVLSTNLKNYTDGSSLLRHWNVNTSFGAYISYRTGDYRWQFGPQFRYQQLSTFKSAYPIKEYLLDYGIKLSVTKTIR